MSETLQLLLSRMDSDWPAAVPLEVLQRGVCRNSDSSIWFGKDDGTSAAYGMARSICDGCPVLQRCRAYACSEPSLMGVWGGMSRSEREGVIWPNSARADARRPAQPKVTITYITQGQRQWQVNVSRFVNLQTGGRIVAKKADLGDALESVWTQSQGIPTALRMIEAEMELIEDHMRSVGLGVRRTA